MEEKLTPHEALADFCKWAFHSDNYNTFTAKQRHYFCKTLADSVTGKAGIKRIRKMIVENSPRDMYAFHEGEAWFTKNEETK